MSMNDSIITTMISGAMFTFSPTETKSEREAKRGQGRGWNEVNFSSRAYGFH